MNKQKHTYSKSISLEVEYKYDENYKKVYNLKKLKRQFQVIANKYKK
ncbi:MAG: hypothetical protein GOVbin7581_1 [Prokaryotic dsDNA virus sp.]|nr:MAG: hypothetical protein GOVbin7581_1 [Prokaryotic dsDNA virus sp.]